MLVVREFLVKELEAIGELWKVVDEAGFELSYIGRMHPLPGWPTG